MKQGPGHRSPHHEDALHEHRVGGLIIARHCDGLYHRNTDGGGVVDISLLVAREGLDRGHPDGRGGAQLRSVVVIGRLPLPPAPWRLILVVARAAQPLAPRALRRILQKRHLADA